MPTLRSAPSSPESAPSARTWFRAMQNIRREHGFEPLRVEGAIPEGLRGTCVRNGPGLVELLGRRYDHWFDGDGALSGVRFSDGAAEGAVRILKTEGLREERERGKPYFGAYGSKAPGFWNPMRALRFANGTSKNPANTNVLAWNERLFALCEIGRPFEVDPHDLSSLGETDLGGAIPMAFSAHPHRVAADGRVYNIGLRIGRPNAIDLFRLEPGGGAERVAQLPLDFPTHIHDFAATERHLVIFVAPVRLQLLPMIFGLRSFEHCLSWEPARGTEVIVVPLDAPNDAKRFSVAPFWAWHTANAYEAGDAIVVDLVKHDDFPSSRAWLDAISHGERGGPPGGYLERATLDVRRETLRFERLRERTGEFPRVAPRADGGEHRTIYWAEHSTEEVGAHGPPDTIARFDARKSALDAFTFGAGHKPSEAVFAPRPNSGREDDGWLITLVYDPDAHESYWAVFDAAHVSDGPLAKAWLGQHVPLTFHGAWLPSR